MMLRRLIPAALLLAAVPAAADAAATTTSAGLSIVFASNAAPASVKNAQGDELLGVGSSGFTLTCSPTNHGDKTRPNACPRLGELHGVRYGVPGLVAERVRSPSASRRRASSWT
jgi:hypothetical protein